VVQLFKDVGNVTDINELQPSNAETKLVIPVELDGKFIDVKYGQEATILATLVNELADVGIINTLNEEHPEHNCCAEAHVIVDGNFTYSRKLKLLKEFEPVVLLR
jgi:hypothetical protein